MYQNLIDEVIGLSLNCLICRAFWSGFSLGMDPEQKNWLYLNLTWKVRLLCQPSSLVDFLYLVTIRYSIEKSWYAFNLPTLPGLMAMLNLYNSYCILLVILGPMIRLTTLILVDVDSVHFSACLTP